MRKTLFALAIVALFATSAYAYDDVRGWDLDGTSSPILTGTVTVKPGPLKFTVGGPGFHLMQSSAAEGLAGEDLRIGLDESNRTLIIADRGDIETDFGLLAESNPTILIKNAANSASVKVSAAGLTSDSSFIITTAGTGWPLKFQMSTDVSSANPIFFFTQANAGVELTASGGNQDFIYVAPEIKQTDTAGYNGLALRVSETSLGSGAKNLIYASTYAANDANPFAGAETVMFTVSNTGLVHITPADSSALTDLLVNPAVKTSGNLMDLQVGGVSRKYVTAGGATISSGTYYTNTTAPGIGGAFIIASTFTDAANSGFVYRGKPAIHAAGTDLEAFRAFPDLTNNHTGGRFLAFSAPSLTTPDADVTKTVLNMGTGWQYALGLESGAEVANGSVATTITSLGPTGAQTTIQGWIPIIVGGTPRYIPYW